ncbi:YihY/virulence factor BrkB family protein [Homoserinimonas sp. A447]
MKQKLQKLIAWAQGFRPVRVFLHYTESRGPLLAGGLSFQAIFAVFAALWVGFSVAGLLVDANPDIRQAFFRVLNESVPGLIDTGSGEGIVDPDDLQTGIVLSWTGAIALGGLLFTALGWLASARDAIRTLFGLPGEMLNFLLLKLKDVGLGIGFGAALLISSALLVFSTQAVTGMLDLLGIGEKSLFAVVAGRAVGLILMFLLDTVALAALYRLLSGLSIPWRRLAAGALLGAAGLGVLKVLGSALLGGASRNPLLASFALIIGLLIWFNLICQVILLAASWIAVGMTDAGIIPDPKVAEERRKEAQERAQEREARKVEAEEKLRRSLPWWRRVMMRRKHDGGRR